MILKPTQNLVIKVPLFRETRVYRYNCRSYINSCEDDFLINSDILTRNIGCYSIGFPLKTTAVIVPNS